MDITEIADAFKKARLQKNYSQQHIAEITGLGLSTISKLENNAASDIGTAKLIILLSTVGLELYTRPAGHKRTLDDIERERSIEPEPHAQRHRASRYPYRGTR